EAGSNWRARLGRARCSGWSFHVPDRNVRIPKAGARLDSPPTRRAAMATRMFDATGAGEPKEIVTTLFQLAPTSYRAPPIIGFMQAERQERRKWVSKERFLEGLAVANMVPGATATQLGIFLAYARGGWWGGLLGGIAFVLPAFVIMLALTIAYASFGVTPLARSALYGLGPVVIGLFAIALYRLGRTAATTVPEVLIGIAAASALATTRLGIVAILVLAGCAGLFAFYRGPSAARVRSVAALLFVVALSLAVWGSTSASLAASSEWTPAPKNLVHLWLFFLQD